MEVNNALAPATPPATGRRDDQAAAVLSSDFETFLQMLTAQARYQDPLEPMDSSQYAAQLAQFSMVEQQVQSNDLLRSLGDQLGQSNIAQAASWIGMEARTTAPVQFDGEAVVLYPQVDGNADSAVLIAYGADGSEVRRQQLPPDVTEFQWTGLTEGGSELPSGLYSFVVESRANDRPISEAPVESYARISEARNANGRVEFILNGGYRVLADEVAALREPS